MEGPAEADNPRLFPFTSVSNFAKALFYEGGLREGWEGKGGEQGSPKRKSARRCFRGAGKIRRLRTVAPQKEGGVCRAGKIWEGRAFLGVPEIAAGDAKPAARSKHYKGV